MMTAYPVILQNPSRALVGTGDRELIGQTLQHAKSECTQKTTTYHSAQVESEVLPGKDAWRPCGILPFVCAGGIIHRVWVWLQSVEVSIALQIRLGSRKGSTELPQAQIQLPSGSNDFS